MSLTQKQRELARHALGLPNRNRRSYRNRFVCEENEPNWCQMVADGHATMRAGDTLPFGGDACFYLTLAGAKAALDPREKLCVEDFPTSVTHPILFSAPMIRALLNGSKTQTRRILKPQPEFKGAQFRGFVGMKSTIAVFDRENYSDTPQKIKLPVNVGSLLWVREAWAPLDALAHNDCGTQALADRCFYRADNGTVEGEITRWRPSIHMPRRISRLTLHVTDVRIQRLQDISEEDAIVEGVEKDSDGWRDYLMPHTQCCASARDSFRTLWDTINGSGAWDANPWVVANSFKVHHSNIDAVMS